MHDVPSVFRAEDTQRFEVAKARGAGRRSALWCPTRPELTLFMQSRITCPACRLAREAAGKPAIGYLHVRRSGATLVITEFDDLHHPGKSLHAARLVDFATLSLFRFTSTPVTDVHPNRFRAAAGMVTLAWIGRRRHLHAVGTAAGIDPRHDALFDAIEAGG